jgi:NitT/TauT family transport system permease protein
MTAGSNLLEVNPPDRRNARFWRSLVSFYKRFQTPIHTVLSIVLGAIVWQIAAAHVSPLVMVPLGDIWAAFLRSLGDGTFWADFVASFQGFALGFVLATIFGILIGVVMAVSKVVFDFLDPWVSAMYATPLIALAPLFILVFGIGMSSRVVVVLLVSIFPIIMNTATGIRTTDQKLIETAHSFGANRRQIFVKILLPWSVPFIVTGLRLAIGRGLIGFVVAEFFGSTEGIGHRVFAATQSFNTADLWMGVFTLTVAGVILTRLMYFLERKIAPGRSAPVGRQ